MSNQEIPHSLIEYYNTLNNQWNTSIPTCPVCKNKMHYIRHDFMEYRNEIGAIRKFKCTHCLEKEVLLWRR